MGIAYSRVLNPDCSHCNRSTPTVRVYTRGGSKCTRLDDETGTGDPALPKLERVRLTRVQDGSVPRSLQVSHIPLRIRGL